MLEPLQRCFYTIIANCNGPLEGVDCHIHRVRYDMAVKEVLAAVAGGLIRSPTMLKRCRYDEQMLEPLQRCFYTIMANCNGSIEAVECHIHSVRYDMAVKEVLAAVSDGLIRSPLTL